MSGKHPTQYRFARWTAWLAIAAAVPAYAQQQPKDNPPDPADALLLHVRIVQVDTPVSTNGAAPAVSESPEQIANVTERAIQAGTGRERYTADVPMMVGRLIQITEGIRYPLVRRVGKTDAGVVQRSISYEDVGFKISLTSEWSDPAARDRVQLGWDISMEDLDQQREEATSEDQDSAAVFYKVVFKATSLAAPNETIAFRTSAQPTADGSQRTYVVIARLMQQAAGEQKPK